jgi:hypothetical protein
LLALSDDSSLASQAMPKDVAASQAVYCQTLPTPLRLPT